MACLGMAGQGGSAQDWRCDVTRWTKRDVVGLAAMVVLLCLTGACIKTAATAVEATYGDSWPLGKCYGHEPEWVSGGAEGGP